MNKLSRKRKPTHENRDYRSALVLYEANDGDAAKVHSILKSENPGKKIISISTLNHFPRAIKDAKSSTPAASLKNGIIHGQYTRGMAQACADRYCPGVINIDELYSTETDKSTTDLFSEAEVITISIDEYTAYKAAYELINDVIRDRDIARKYAEEYERAYQEEKAHRIDAESKLNEIKQIINS